VVWTPEGILIEQIEISSIFTESLIRKSKKFYVEQMLPAIPTHNILDANEFPPSSSNAMATSNEEAKYCFCQEGEYGKMICCDNPDIYKCVGIKRVLRENWLCPNCKI